MGVMTNLSAQQQAGMEAIRKWHSAALAGGPQVMRLAGPAGTGKTTLAKRIPEALGIDGVVYGTYTGKAAHVLRTKGASPVSTIHSAIYTMAPDPEALRALREARQDIERLTGTMATSLLGSEEWHTANTTRDEIEAQLPALEAATRKLHWEFDPLGDWSYADLIILDEVSMVNREMAMDIESYGLPVLVLGDPAQLPPVKGEGYYLVNRPDFMLTEVHRQALESPVLRLATRIREADARGPLPGLVRSDCEPASLAAAMEADQIICWSNRQRWALTAAVRKRKGFPSGRPAAGDKIMCLANNRDLGVFNGQQFSVAVVQEDKVGYTMTLGDENGEFREIKVFADGFESQELQDQAKDSGLGMKYGRMLATYSWAITCHKAQGSEWPKVYIANEMTKMYAAEQQRRSSEMAARQCQAWMYTAVTRASESVTITAPRG